MKTKNKKKLGPIEGLDEAYEKIIKFANNGEEPNLESVIKDPQRIRFLQLLDKMRELAIRKAHDYGEDEDTFSNLKRSKKFGVKPSVGVFIRMGDKFSRIEELSQKPAAVEESIEDNLMDISVYALLAIVLREKGL